MEKVGQRTWVGKGIVPEAPSSVLTRNVLLHGKMAKVKMGV